LSRLLGLDFGGTNIKVVILADAPGVDPEVVWSDQRPTRAEGGPDVVVGELIGAARDAVDGHGPIDAVGLGIPGVFDPEAGTILLFPNFPGEWAGHPIRQPISEALGLPMALINDARAFTLAEGTIGAGRGCRSIVAMTLGTGIGGGVMIDGKLVTGASGRAGEVGHQIVEVDGPRCGCGNRGCVEALTRAGVLTRLAGKGTVEEVYRAAASGDERSSAAVARVADYLGVALANMVTVIGPERIVVGGGVMAGGERVLDPIRQAVLRHVTLAPPETISVVAAELGTMAGAIGAALASARRFSPG
jgi:glucokinase